MGIEKFLASGSGEIANELEEGKSALGKHNIRRTYFVEKQGGSCLGEALVDIINQK